MNLELTSGTDLYGKVMDTFAGVRYTSGHSKWSQDDSWPVLTATLEIDGAQQEYRLIALHDIAYTPDNQIIQTEWYPVGDWPYGRPRS